ncbi:hypothetical protein [Mesorhizobium sp. WSM3859]|uniref:hypothetical protein n=1 Tax=Mesorhizobium sp. WSM3859 TaxID=2029402 RepID=UPI000BAF69C9|nr:hypothetical protein [Mesorhizobium sp. WSM3859]PBC09380.1 hypothetical protein CK230_14620 [Mesorhizobium sp. WSM3859]
MHAAERITNVNGKNVIVVQAGDEWHVMVEEPGVASKVRTFNTEAYAASYAEGQRIRLHLDKVVHI